jgi:hypothetical protein
MIKNFYIEKFCALSSDGAGACTYRSGDIQTVRLPTDNKKLYGEHQ